MIGEGAQVHSTVMWAFVFTSIAHFRVYRDPDAIRVSRYGSDGR